VRKKMNIKKGRIGTFCILFLVSVFALGSISHAPMISLNKAFAYEYHEGSSTLRTSSSGAAVLSVETPRNVGGNIRIQVWAKDEVVVEYEKKAKADTKEEAREFAEMIGFDLHKTGDIITLEISTPGRAPWQGTDKSVRVGLDIFVPEHFNLVSETIYFDYDVSGPLKSVDIKNGYGKIRVKGVVGETNIETSYGGVEAEDLSGGVNIETSYGPIFLANVDARNKTVFVETAYDKIDMTKVRGNIKARTNYSSINGTDLELVGGTSSFETVYNKVDLRIRELKDSDLFVQNTYGNVLLGLPATASAEISFSIDIGGRIETSGIPIVIESVDQTSLEGIIGEGESKVQVGISGIGKILLESYK
jgi:hypothetical protein